jgi:hypothetical protein
MENRPNEQLEGEAEGGKGTRDDRFARAVLDAAQGVLAVAESLRQNSEDTDSGDQGHEYGCLSIAQKLFSSLSCLPGLRPGVNAQALFGEAQAGLAIGAVIAESMEGGDGEDRTDQAKSVRKEAIDALRGGELCFAYASSLRE